MLAPLMPAAIAAKPTQRSHYRCAALTQPAVRRLPYSPSQLENTS